MATHRSNIYFAGGPWQPNINNQQYIQYSNEFVKAIIALTEALEMPFGETGAQYCGDLEDPLYSAFSG